jgi:bisphosphoglycerate-dependent phosphoglycerate mutase
VNIRGQFENLAKVLGSLDAYWGSIVHDGLASEAEALVKADAGTLARVVDWLDQHVDDVSDQSILLIMFLI